MSKKYYIEAMSDETLAKMIDKTLNFEKREKAVKINILKIIPAAAAIVLVVALANIFPVINFTGGDAEITPGVMADNEVEIDEAEEATIYSSILPDRTLPITNIANIPEELDGKDGLIFSLRWSWADGKLIYSRASRIASVVYKSEESGKLYYSLIYTHTFQQVFLYGRDAQVFSDSKEYGVFFGAYTYDLLYDSIENYLYEQVESGNMTREEAAAKLAEVADEDDPVWNESGTEQELKILPVPPPNPSMVQLAYDRGYRDSLEYTKFNDSTFAQRMNNLSEEENKFIFRMICAGDSIPVADDIVGMIAYDIKEFGMEEADSMIVLLELADGDIAAFEIKIDRSIFE